VVKPLFLVRTIRGKQWYREVCRVRADTAQDAIDEARDTYGLNRRLDLEAIRMKPAIKQEG
jgi:hypothetical protein